MDFYDELVILKTIERSGWRRKKIDGRIESDAEHTFSMLLMAMKMMWKHELGLDQLKVLKMIAVHELGEIDVGDITPFDGISAEQKHAAERAAVQRIAEQYELPEAEKLWTEFEEAGTKEARFVKALDKYDAVKQAQNYERRGLAPAGTAD